MVAPGLSRKSLRERSATCAYGSRTGWKTRKMTATEAWPLANLRLANALKLEGLRFFT